MELVHVPPMDLKVSPFCLPGRSVLKDSVEYIQLRESMRKGGQDLPLLIRQGNQIVDGHARREAAIDLRWDTIDCIPRIMSDFDVLVKQLQVNVATRQQYAGRLWRIMEQRPEMTIDDLSHTVMKTREWLSSILNLDSLVDIDSVYSGETPVLIGAELAKLPADYQKQLNTLVKVLTTSELVDIVRVSVRKYLESLKDTRALRNLRNVQEIRPRFRNGKEVRQELDSPSAASIILNRLKAETAWQGWQACLKWVLSVDPISLEQRIAALQRMERNNSNGLGLNSTLEDKDTEH